MAAPVRIINREHWWATLLFALTIGSLWIWLAFEYATGSSEVVTGAATSLDRFGDAAVNLGCAAFMWGIWLTLGRCYVEADDRGITVRNLWRPRFVPWNDVTGLVAHRGQSFAWLQRLNGKPIRLMAVGGVRLRRGPTLAEEQVARLEARRPAPAAAS